MMIKIKENKGFTLIELLAVIVILAVIALIAVPQILNILNKARKSAAEDTTSGIIKSAENYVTSFMLQNNGVFPDGVLTFECTIDGCQLKTELNDYNLDNLEELDFKGTKPTSGTITISNSGKNINTTNLNINNFVCAYLDGQSICTDKRAVKENGTVVYFNPITGKECSASEYTENQSVAGTKEGCMKWYIFLDSEESAVYNLLLDHNTNPIGDDTYVVWSSANNSYEGPKEVIEKLKETTDSWIGVPNRTDSYSVNWTHDNQNYGYTVDYNGYKARLIEAEEAAKILSLDDWNLEYKHGNIIPNSKKWLAGDFTTSGKYWTSTVATKDFNNGAWFLHSSTFTYTLISLTAPSNTDKNYFGVRPVITISKSVIK